MRIKPVVSLCLFLVMMPLLATAAPADRNRHAIAGTVVCGGNQLMRNKGTEFHWTVYAIRNMDHNDAIFIDRVRFIDATGATLFDSAVSGLPPFFNNVIGPADNSLDALQSTQLSSRDVLGSDVALPRAQRPIQVHIDWSAATPALSLDVVGVRVVRERAVVTDGFGNTTVRIGAERSRHAVACRTIRHHHH